MRQDHRAGRLGLLNEGGRRDDTIAALYRRLIEAGLDISFVYPRAGHCQMRGGDLEAAVAVARPISGTQPYHDKDLVQLRLRGASALAALGRNDAARKALQVALWHAATDAELSRVVPRLIILGGLDSDNFLPASPEVLALAGRAQSYTKVQATGLGHLDWLRPEEARKREVKRGALEPLLWDWDVLLSAGKMVERTLSGDISKRIVQTIRMFQEKGRRSVELGPVDNQDSHLC